MPMHNKWMYDMVWPVGVCVCCACCRWDFLLNQQNPYHMLGTNLSFNNDNSSNPFWIMPRWAPGVCVNRRKGAYVCLLA
jgi:hypothetical protein